MAKNLYFYPLDWEKTRKTFQRLEQDRAKLFEKFQTELFAAGEMDSVSPSADDILNHYLKSIGGRDRVDAIKSMMVTGKIVVPLGGPLQLDGILKSYHSNNSKMYQYIELKGFDITEQGVNGDICWKKGSYSGIRLLAGDEKKSLLLESSIEANKPELFTEKKYLGRMDIQGTLCDKLVLTTKDGFSIAKYFDVSTGLLKATMKIVQTKNEGPEKTFTLIENYMDVQGIKFPHQISENTTKQNLFAIRTDYYTVEFDYEIHGDILEKYFNLPDDIHLYSN